MDKQAFYQREDVVADYDSWRFGSVGGKYVDDQELGAVLHLLGDLPRQARVLDMPCGTGRLLRALAAAGFSDLWGADTSPAMLERAARSAESASLRCADAFATGFAPDSFAAVCSLRFLFHVPEPSKLFAEVARLLLPGGLFVFDSIRWSPRGVLAPVDRALGGDLYRHQDAEVTELLFSAGFALVSTERKFPLPTLAYRFLPQLALDAVRWATPLLPAGCFTKTFYLARKRL
jgi:SAM-dependent methyltransferase